MRYSWQRWLRLLIVWNLGIAAALVATQWLSRQGIMLPGYFVGTIVLMAPGLLGVLVVEQLAGRTAVGSSLMLWAMIASLTIVPAFVYLVDKFVLSQTGILEPLPAFGIVWIAILVALGVLIALRRIRSGLTLMRLNRVDVRELSLIVGGFLVVYLINVLLYPFVPEADGYGYLIKLRDMTAQPELIAGEPRVLFLTFVKELSVLTSADPYLVLRVGFPSLFISIVASCYLVARTVLKSTAGRVAAALSPLAFPVVLQEMLIGRPQSLVLLTLVPTLYLVARLDSAAATREIYWLLLLLTIGIVGLKIHTLMVLLLILVAVGALRLLWPYVRARPVDSFVVAGLLLVLAFPWLDSIRIIGDMWHIVELAWQAVARGNVTFWFIDHYRNVDGAEVGWPGFSWLLYYGYNLGLFLPAVLLMISNPLQWSGGKLFKDLVKEWPALMIGTLMLVIAELLPRFGLAYLPDRAWLFIALCTSLILPYLLATQFLNNRRMRLVVSFLLFCSVLAGTYVTYAKQGWVTVAEYAAVPFIKTETPPTTVILGQGGSRPAVRYFAERQLTPPSREVFMSDDENAVEEYLVAQKLAYDKALVRLRNDQISLGQSFDKIGADIVEITDQSQVLALKSEVGQLITAFDPLWYDEAELKKAFVLEDQSIYILYDRTKFDSLYGQRAWWRASNFYGANTEKFSKKYPLVYDQGGVMIWKVR